jgi:hypothetical protein
MLLGVHTTQVATALESWSAEVQADITGMRSSLNSLNFTANQQCARLPFSRS